MSMLSSFTTGSPCQQHQVGGEKNKKNKKQKKPLCLFCHWYLMGISLFLMIVTTTIRVTLHLSRRQSTAQIQENPQAIVPSELFHHMRNGNENNININNNNNNNKNTAADPKHLPTKSSGRPKIVTRPTDKGSSSLSPPPPPPPKKSVKRLVRPDDFIYEYHRKQWDSAPIVLEEYKLIFFTIPKVACTTFKQLFRRMMNLTDWKSQDPGRMLPHNPKTNGLKYLWHYTLDEANTMMTSPDYTRAIFVRDPKSRFLSAFLDKGMGNFDGFVLAKCCPQTRDCAEQAQTSEGFLKLIHKCSDPHWDPQAARMEAKYWKYINFVGHFEHLSQDGPALLKKIGAWDEFGTTGWGKYGNGTLFQTSAADQTHTTGSSGKVWQWLFPALERKIESYYEGDYKHPLFDFHITNLTKDFWIKGTDKIYAKGPWDGAPIVVKKYKLVFFSIPRIGSLLWKQAFRRMEGLLDWNDTGGPKGLPHDPAHNGLKYLYDFDAGEAEQIIKDPSWTKAIFIRDPKDRFMEVYSHMSQHPAEVAKQCCPRQGGCEMQSQSLIQLLDLSMHCKSDQWEPQSHRMEKKYWEYVNFIGRMETIQEDSKQLLDRIGAWEEIGARGWGVNGTERMFAPTGHEHGDAMGTEVSSTVVVDRHLEQIYKEDYENERFGFAKQPT